MSRIFQSIVGNKSLCSRLSSAIFEGSLSHAYIFEGQKGSGRHTLALEAVAAICCAEKGTDKPLPCKGCISCRKILEGRSPDVYRIGLVDDKVSIGIDAVRFLKSDIYLPPTDLPFKVYIIDDAETMTTQAQNAFLLSLEEPPEHVLFFLICNDSAPLLETIKSRAPTLRTEKIPQPEIKKYLLENERRARAIAETSAEELDELVCAADGSIGYAIELLDSRKRKTVFEHRQTAKDFIFLASKKTNRDKIELISSLGTKRHDIISRLLYIQYAIRDLILLKKSEEAPLCFYSDREDACEISTRYTSKKLYMLYKAIETAIDDLGRNANVRLTMINMLKNSNLI